MFLSALIEVLTHILGIVCIAETTFVIVDNALLVNDRQLLFFWFHLASELMACIYGVNSNSNFAA